MTQAPSSPLPDPGRFLPRLRDQTAPSGLREEAWGDFVRWLYLAHFVPCLEGRLYRRLEARGLVGRIGPGDVFRLYCFRVRENPALLGERPVPTRSWLSTGLVHVARDLEKQVRRQPRDLPEVATQTAVSLSEAPSASEYLASPEAVVLLRELEGQLLRELERLESESPKQHRAWSLGAAGTRYQEISELLDTSVGNVKSLVKRARDTLRARLEVYLRTGGGRS